MTKRQYVESVSRDLMIAWMRTEQTSGDPPVGGIVRTAVSMWEEIDRLVPRDEPRELTREDVQT